MTIAPLSSVDFVLSDLDCVYQPRVRGIDGYVAVAGHDGHLTDRFLAAPVKVATATTNAA